MWTACFPNVKIREFKAVSGKCKTCAILSDLRRKCNDKQRKQEITYLHCLHRSAYMNERLEYRAFSADNVIELVEDDSTITGMSGRSTKVFSYPRDISIE